MLIYLTQKIKTFLSVFSLFVVMFSAVGVSGYAQSELVPDNICPNNRCPVINNPDTLANSDQNTVARIILNVAQILTFIGVALAVLFLVYGGIRYITAGTADANETGKKIIIQAVIGLVIAIIAYTIVSLVASLLQGNIGGEIVQNA